MKINILSVKRHVQQIPWVLGEYAFLFTLGLIVFAFALNFLLLFFTVLSPASQERVSVSTTKFQQEYLQQVTTEWQTRSEMLSQEYSPQDLFSPSE
jgi:hypothetical protein